MRVAGSARVPVAVEESFSLPYKDHLIDGRMDLQKLLILSPFDPFNTLFHLSKLQQERAIVVPQ